MRHAVLPRGTPNSDSFFRTAFPHRMSLKKQRYSTSYSNLLACVPVTSGNVLPGRFVIAIWKGSGA